MGLHLVVDMDDVLLEFWKYVCQCYHREYHDQAGEQSAWEYTFNSTVDWNSNPVKDAPEFAHLPAGWWTWWEKHARLWPNAKAMPGAIGALAQLREAGHYIELCTKKPDWATWTVWAWLAKWQPECDLVRILPLDGKKEVESTGQVLIDDNVENAHAWADSYPNRTAILFSQPWNRDAVSVPGVLRAYNWAEVQRLTSYELF